MNELLATISLCKRAGKLALGFDVVKRAVDDKTAVLVIVASDISERTLNEMQTVCKNRITMRKADITMAEIEFMLSKRFGVMAVTDNGLAQKINGILDRTNGEETIL